MKTRFIYFFSGLLRVRWSVLWSALFFPALVLAQEILPCADQGVPIRTAGFLGFGDSAKKIRTLATLHPTESGDFDKELIVGIYKFRRANGSWEVFRKHGDGYGNGDGNSYSKHPAKFPIRVFADQPIYVSQRAGNTLEIRRNTDDRHSTSVSVQFLKNNNVLVSNKSAQPILSVSACPKNDDASEPKQNLDPRPKAQ